MPAEITRQTIAEYNVISPVGAEVMDDVQTPPSGSYRGETVKPTADVSRLADAAEEIGMALEARGSDRRLTQRSTRPGRGTTFDTVANIKDYFEKLPNMPREAELANLAEAFSKFQDQLAGGGGGGEAPTKEDVLAALAQFDPDVSHQYAALEIMREHFEAAGADPKLLALLDDARGVFQQTEVARDVHAGFMVAKVADQMAATMESSPQMVRDAFRGMMRDEPNMGRIFDTLVQHKFNGNVSLAVESFTTAIGHELSALGPNADRVQLQTYMSELKKLKQMQTVIDRIKQLLAQTDRTLPMAERGGADEGEQTSRFLNFTGKASAGPGDARRLLGHYERRSTKARIVLLTALMDLHRSVPDSVPPSSQARLQQAGAIMALLDSTVAEEERAESRMGS